MTAAAGMLALVAAAYVWWKIFGLTAQLLAQGRERSRRPSVDRIGGKPPREREPFAG